MGEYAQYNGERIKIGTCESMYYLRADQAHLVTALSGNVDPIGDREEIRFRFPFPDEDALEPGQFEDYDRGVKIPSAWTLPADYDHDGSVQFTAQPGYLLSLPCPESPAFPADLKFFRNGWSGGYEVRQTRSIEGQRWTVVACGSCGSAWRLPQEVAATVAEAFCDEADRTDWRRKHDPATGELLDEFGHEYAHTSDGRRFLVDMAGRIMAGYHEPEDSEIDRWNIRASRATA